MVIAEATRPTGHPLLTWLGVLARLVFGGVWIAAEALKIPDPAESVRAVRACQLLPEAIAPRSATRWQEPLPRIGAWISCGCSVGSCPHSF